MACFLYDLQNDRVDAHIVITQSYLKSNWADEARDWGFKPPVVLWPTIPTEKQLREPHVIVINQEAVLYSGGKYLKTRLNDHRVRYSLSVDDASIKNHNGLTSRAIRELGQDAPIHRDLCGTPMSQSVMDLYARLRFLGELNGWNPYQFRNKFAVMGGYMGKKVVGAKNEEELHEILGRCVFRALKRDWWKDMPEKIPLVRKLEMAPAQVKAYRQMLSEFYYMVKDDDNIFADAVVHQKQKLQQISRGFLLDRENDRVIELVAPKDNPAIQITKKIVEDTPGKLLIFTHYVYSTDLLERELKDYGIVVLRGGMTTEEIIEAKARFNNDRSVKVLIGIDRVTARGHTLLGTEDMRCSTSLMYESSYDLEMRSQLEDRNHRWGQDRAVNYIDLWCCSEDRAIIEALQRKQSMVEAIVNAVRAHHSERIGG